MRRLLSLAIALAAVPVAGQAASNVAAAFGNTIVSTYPDGRTGLLWLKADGTYTGKGRRRLPSSGTWTIKSSQVCFRQLRPRRAPFSYCTKLPSTSVWSARAVTGERVQVRIVEGVVD